MKKNYRLLLFSVLIGSLVVVGGLFLDLSKPMAASDQVPSEVSSEQNQLVVRIYYESQERLNEIAGGLDIWEVHKVPGIGPGSGYVIAAVYPAQQVWLESLNYRVEFDEEHTELLQSPTAILDPRYYYFDDYFNNANDRYIVNFLQDTNAAHPELTELIDIGDAWLGLHMGYHRDIWVLRVSNEDPSYGDVSLKPPFFLFANVHAREVSTPEMAIRYIKYLTDGYNGQGGYNVDPDVTWLVNHHVVYVLVSENPDGRVKNEQNTGEYWRKNVDNDDGCNYADSWGTDLNRNSSFKWGCCGGSSGDPCSDTYRGVYRGSEPEIFAFQSFATQVFSDWNGTNGDDEIPQASPDITPGIFISLHSYQDEILWPFGFSPGGAPNNSQLQTIGHKLADMTTNEVMNPTGWLYTVDGSNDDWVYGKLGIAAFTYEIGPTWGSCGDFFPAYGCQDGIDGMPRNFWAEMSPSFVYANKIARSPYKTAYGPDTSEILANPASAPAGTPINLSATVADSRYTGDPLHNVFAAEYFIDTEGADGTGIPMSASDGAWDEVSEGVLAEVDTSGLSAGTHYILVHGKTTISNTDYWGPFTAIFIEITAPLVPEAGFTSNSPVELGQTVVFTNTTIGSEPLSYAWDFGDNFGTSTEKDPTYLYEALGTYTVTLVSDNPFGSDIYTDTVSVVPVAISEINIVKTTDDPLLPGDEIEFTVDISPDNAAKPYEYTIDFGDGTSLTDSSSDDPLVFTHTYTHSGWYTVQVSVKNTGMTNPVIDELSLKVLYRNLLPTISK